MPNDDECDLIVRLKEGRQVLPGELGRCVEILRAVYQFRRVKAREILIGRGVNDSEVLKKHLDWASYLERARG